LWFYRCCKRKQSKTAGAVGTVAHHVLPDWDYRSARLKEALNVTSTRQKHNQKSEHQITKNHNNRKRRHLLTDELRAEVEATLAGVHQGN
jgi:hypothetical protein